MNINELRIIKSGDSFQIQKPIKTFFGKKTGQWETLGDADWAAVYSTLEDARRQIRHWHGEDVNKEFVVE